MTGNGQFPVTTRRGRQRSSSRWAGPLPRLGRRRGGRRPELVTERRGAGRVPMAGVLAARPRAVQRACRETAPLVGLTAQRACNGCAGKVGPARLVTHARERLLHRSTQRCRSSPHTGRHRCPVSPKVVQSHRSGPIRLAVLANPASSAICGTWPPDGGGGHSSCRCILSASQRHVRHFPRSHHVPLP